MIRRFLKAGFGGLGAQLLNFGFLPLLSRVYSPHAYAGWAIVVLAATLIGSTACLRLELAIVLPRDEIGGRTTFWLCMSLGVVTTLLVALAVSTPQVRSALAHEGAGGARLTVLVPLLTLFFSLSLIMQYWCIRQQAFALHSLSTIALAAFTNGAHLLLGRFRSNDEGSLLIGSAVGQGGTALLLAVGLLAIGKLPSLRGIELAGLRAAFRTHRHFALFSTPYTLLNFVRDRTTLYLLEVYLSRAQVGYYALTQRLTTAPVSLVAGSLRPVIFQSAAAEGIESVGPRIQRLMSALAVVTSPLVVLFIFNSAELFQTFFGPEWRPAGRMGLFLVWPAYTFLFSTWLDRLLDVMGKQRLALFLQSVFSVGSVIVILIGFHFSGMIGGLLGECLVSCACNIAFIVVVFWSARFSLRLLLRPALSAAIALAVGTVAMLILKRLVPLWPAIGAYLTLLVATLVLGRKRWMR